MDGYSLHIKVRTSSTPISFPKTTDPPSPRPSPSPRPDSNDNLGKSDKTLSMIGLRAETSRAGRPTNRKRWQIPAIHGATHHKASTSTEYSIRTGKTPGRLIVLYRHDTYILVNPVGLGGPQYRKYPASLLGYKWTIGRALELQWARLAL
ncbi:uncharacterized protein ASPGLDRAFT_836068 [Aspergillus glaucus CBS 516.65]|uniref:Uncharacterized protein n=1 Tax=Aspergillus glaucus CBS 516.65 TaxID=1160497 RepID=A0A1L9VA40_ASPGL|nr:hypothetical protein ASPGLDRAFT_836068 [Aspergillus glaucus CBS 516.65]OJJ80794.1 hypothetical protein ASPGLDRAFT_836068 [Aspergillus glaucus CBS 516.65]